MDVQVAADVGERDELRRLPAKRRLAQLGRAERNPERAIHALLVPPVRERLQRLDVLRRPGRPHELGPETPRLGDDELDRNALDRHPDRPPLRRSTIETICGSCSNRSSTARLRSGAHDREHLARVPPSPRIARDLAAERLGDATAQRERPVEEQTPPRSRPFASLEGGEELRLRLRPDPGHLPQPPSAAAARNSSTVRTPSARPISPARWEAEPEQPTEPDELRRDLALQRVQLREPPGLDELAQPCLDPGPDPTQVAHTPCADELGNRRWRLANRFGRAAVRTRRVRARPRDVEQPGQRVEPVGDLRVREDHAP